ncbi:MAG: hypothetical protein ACLP8S_05315 [Solirubrobacteraceae bacterium]
MRISLPSRPPAARAAQVGHSSRTILEARAAEPSADRRDWDSGPTQAHDQATRRTRHRDNGGEHDKELAVIEQLVSHGRTAV